MLQEIIINFFAGCAERELEEKELTKAAFLINNIRSEDDIVILLKSLNNKPDIFYNKIIYQNIIKNSLERFVDKIKLEKSYNFFKYLDKKIIAKLINYLICEIKEKEIDKYDTKFYSDNIIFLLKIFCFGFDYKKERNIELIRDTHELFILKFILQLVNDNKLELELFNNYLYFSDLKNNYLDLCRYDEIRKLYSLKNIIYRLKKCMKR